MTTVAVVEDNHATRKMLAELINREAEYRCVCACSTSKEALLEVPKHQPDVVLMDIKLHGFRDGIDSASQIRGFYKTPIVYLSSFPERDVTARLSKTAPFSYIQKPYELPKLQAIISQAIQGSA